LYSLVFIGSTERVYYDFTRDIFASQKIKESYDDSQRVSFQLFGPIALANVLVSTITINLHIPALLIISIIYVVSIFSACLAFLFYKKKERKGLSNHIIRDYQTINYSLNSNCLSMQKKGLILSLSLFFLSIISSVFFYYNFKTILLTILIATLSFISIMIFLDTFIYFVFARPNLKKRYKEMML